ncbi:MAG: hypothetical protein H6510_02575 [Acidobacteria bacterium]|nr:hypothetical protein [Acidobacteriota bacterium]
MTGCFLAHPLQETDFYEIEEVSAKVFYRAINGHGKTYLYAISDAYQVKIFIYDWQHNRQNQSQQFYTVPKDGRIQLDLTGEMRVSPSGIAVLSATNGRVYELDPSGNFLHSSEWVEYFPLDGKIRTVSSWTDSEAFLSFVQADQVHLVRVETDGTSEPMLTADSGQRFLVFEDQILCFDPQSLEIKLFNIGGTLQTTYVLDRNLLGINDLDSVALMDPFWVDHAPYFTLNMRKKTHRTKCALTLRKGQILFSTWLPIIRSPDNQELLLFSLEEGELSIANKIPDFSRVSIPNRP